MSSVDTMAEDGVGCVERQRETAEANLRAELFGKEGGQHAVVKSEHHAHADLYDDDQEQSSTVEQHEGGNDRDDEGNGCDEHDLAAPHAVGQPAGEQHAEDVREKCDGCGDEGIRLVLPQLFTEVGG